MSKNKKVYTNVAFLQCIRCKQLHQIHKHASNWHNTSHKSAANTENDEVFPGDRKLMNTVWMWPLLQAIGQAIPLP